MAKLARLALCWIVIGAALCVPLAFYVEQHTLEAGETSRLLPRILGTTVIFPLFASLCWWSLWMVSGRQSYKLNEEGVFQVGREATAVGWKRVGVFRFSDHLTLSNLRIFEFQTHRLFFESKREMWFSLPFDPREVNEDEIRAVVEAYFQAD